MKEISGDGQNGRKRRRPTKKRDQQGKKNSKDETIALRTNSLMTLILRLRKTETRLNNSRGRGEGNEGKSR